MLTFIAGLVIGLVVGATIVASLLPPELIDVPSPEAPARGQAMAPNAPEIPTSAKRPTSVPPVERGPLRLYAVDGRLVDRCGIPIPDMEPGGYGC